MLFLAGVNVQTCIVSRIHNWPRLDSNQRHTLLGLLYQLSYKVMVERGYLYTAPLPVTAVAIYSHSFLINIPVRFVKLLLELRINNNMASMTRFHGKLRRAVKSCYLLPKISLQPLMRD